MGNSLGMKTKTTKVMKINGETIKLKTPVQAAEVLKDNPGYVLLEHEAVKHLGVRAKPLEFYQELKPKRLYFLVEMPKFPEEKGPRRVRSGIQMSAKDRLESLMLARRSISDLSLMKPAGIMLEESKRRPEMDPMRVKLRLPRAEVEKLLMQSENEAEAAQKIMQLCMANNGKGVGQGAPQMASFDGLGLHPQGHWNGGQGRHNDGLKAREKVMIELLQPKRVAFLPVTEGEIQVASTP
ncbi:hypothetical protein RJ640_006986 [Escallonia rubra]|uniref:Uncharacterized protein n=1 Tax=Escallonia rubra TaxID=112253 RepID=A0AA88UE92_9ASTE|nr:hypothetical protein RJ640_006986 [Escallonia rubra]